MKKLSLIFLLLVAFSGAQSQVVFCPPGAEWHYSFRIEAFGTPQIQWINEQIKYVEDSVIDNTTVKVLSHRRLFKKDSYYPGSPGITFIKQNGDTIFFRNASTGNNWQILYNYAALPGQSWQNTIMIQPVYATSPLSNTYTITVDSVKTIAVNAFNLKRLYVRYTAIIYKGISLDMNTDTVCIDERMGCNQFLFNFYNREYNPDYREYFNGFLCYGDNAFGTLQLSEKECDYTDAVGIKENNYTDFAIQIYPNPSGRFFTITSQSKLVNGECALSISDLSGREVKRLIISLNAGSYKVDLADVRGGLYLVHLVNNNKIIYSSKLIKVE